MKSHAHLLENTPTLFSYAEFERWYLGRTDVEIFSDEDVQGLLKEIRPEHYPCIPVTRKGDFEIFIYLHPAELDAWYNGRNKN